MTHETRSIYRLEIAIHWRLYREAVIMSGDFHLTRSHIFHWLIDTPMAKWQLVGIKSQCSPKNLVTKTNSKDWNLIQQELSNQINNLTHRRWISWTVRDEEAIGIIGFNLSSARSKWIDRNFHTSLRH